MFLCVWYLTLACCRMSLFNQGKAKVAAFLLDAGSNVNAQDVVMNTSLHYVVSAKYANEIKLQLLNILMCYGANCMMLGKDDDTAIDAAYASHFFDGVDLMKESLGTITGLAY